METACKVGGCAALPLNELREQQLCLNHYLDDIQQRIMTFSRRVGDGEPDTRLREAALQFVLLTAAKIATIGVQNAPPDQLTRGRLLNAMLLLADLRERLEAPKPA